MPDQLEPDFQPVSDRPIATRRLPDSQIEIVGDWRFQRPPSHALFDFDGTLSLIREGWPEVMIPMMVEKLQAVCDEAEESLREMVSRFVMELTGKQTIYQMIRLAEEIRQRGGAALEPLQYKDEYHRLLMERITQRRRGLREGTISIESMTVPGCLRFLELLQQRGVVLYMASGTDQNYVREEAELLGLNRYFGERIYGAVDDYRSFSKAQVIERLLSEHRIPGERLVGFGDGYVEIQNTREAGGVAAAIASDEKDRSGKCDPWKRRRLLGAGANVLAPDFAEAELLAKVLWEGV